MLIFQMTGGKSVLQITSPPQGGSIDISDNGLTFVQLENVKRIIDFIHVNMMKPVTHTHTHTCMSVLS